MEESDSDESEYGPEECLQDEVETLDKNIFKRSEIQKYGVLEYPGAQETHFYIEEENTN